MKKSILNIYNKLNTYFNEVKESKQVKGTIHFLTDTSTFKKTMILSLLFVFIFYLPFTFITLFLNKVVFFQLDYVYQFSTIVFDFRNRLMDFNFSTWDFKNSIGYDYFANFYYIPLDITLLPYFLFPFLAYSKLMWLSFIFKIMLGTAAISYLLKLYKMDHKVILLVSVLYGTADLFFAQNVFPSYTGLTLYIPLILIAIELMIQKKNFLIFSLVIFQVFLFNSYWSWALSLFMAFTLFFRSIHHFFTFKNIDKLKTYGKWLYFLGKSILFYLLGMGLAAFFVLPTFGIMQHEPRMVVSDSLFETVRQFLIALQNTFKLNFDNAVHMKQLFKMLVPNLYMYSGFFHEYKSGYYWLATNHVVIYSSILASFSLFFLVLYPTFLAKKKLNDAQLKTFFMLKVVTIIATLMLLFPTTAFAFSMNTDTPYLRWLVFYGFLLIINFAFILQYKLFNHIMFSVFLVISIGYLIFSIQYNRNFVAKYTETHNKAPNIFTGLDENVAYTMIITYIAILFIIILLDKYMRVSFVLFVERAVAIGLIFSITVSPHFTRGVRHADIYGKEINNLMKDVTLEEYYTMTEFLFYNDLSDVETMQDMAYLFDFPVYNNFNIFHSLINPYFNFYNDGNAHKRYYRTFDVPYLYYYYMDPSLFILSNSKENPITNGMYDPNSKLVGYKDIDEFNSYLSIYQKSPKFSIGNGFTTYYTLKAAAKYDYMWLESLYVKDTAIIQNLVDNGFEEEKEIRSQFIKQIPYTLNDVTDYDMRYYSGEFKEFPIHVSQEDSEAVVITTSSKNVFSIDNDNNVNRCFSRFCLVPEVGLKSIVIDKGYPNFFKVNKSYLEEKSEKILKYSAYDVDIDGNHITSKVDNDEPIMMSYKIGYAIGWSAYVDGKKVETFPSYNGQLTFLINETGTHNIELKYETPKLKTGIQISTVSIVIFCGLTYYAIYKRGKRCINTQSS